jgi:hypothetical protein
MSARRSPHRWPIAILLASLVGACGGEPRGPSPATVSHTPTPTDAPTEAGTATPSRAATAVPSDPPTAPPDDPAAGPPTALLAVEGGDPVAASLGTYTWRDGGSDAPWLTGSPLRVGANETLVMAFDPPVPIAGWSARYVPAGAPGPAGAIPLGEGADGPSFALPPPGSWSLELTVTFAGGLGEAHYFWQVDVT